MSDGMNLSDSDRLEIINWAKCHPEIKQVWLYGSRARGDNRPDSDADLAIVMNQAEGDGSAWATWIYWHQDYEKSPDLKLSVEAHLEWYEKDAGLERVGPGVEQDGILIYE
jgi:hypothetical protein